MKQQRQHRRPDAASPPRFSCGPSANLALTEAIPVVVDQQMQDNTPLETQRTFERLVALATRMPITPIDAAPAGSLMGCANNRD
jgi:hypothetical protein